MESVELENSVRNHCCKLLGGVWQQFKNEIIVDKLKMGMGNRTFLCSVKNGETVLQVIVKIYGNASLAGEGNEQTKCMCEAAEGIIFDRLARKGMAPKLYAVFNGGRIEEYVQGRNVTFEDLHDISMYKAVARKLVHFHSQEMPISRNPLYIPLIKKHFLRSKKSKIFANLSDEQRNLLRKLNDFDIEVELEQSLKLASRSGSKKVFSHNDLFVFNILLKDEGMDLFEKLLIIDYELSDYNYRGFDIALFVYGHEFEVIADETDNYYTYLGNSATDELKRTVAEEYLDELKTMNEIIDPEVDNVDHLVMEIEVLGLQFYLAMMIFARLTIYDTDFNFGSLEYIDDFLRLYDSLKNNVRVKYPQLF